MPKERRKLKDRVSSEAPTPDAPPPELQRIPQGGEVLYYLLLLLLLAAPSVANLFWGPVCGSWMGLGAAVIWFFAGRQTGLGEIGCFVHMGGLLGMLLHLLYMQFLWKQMLLQQLRLK